VWLRGYVLTQDLPVEVVEHDGNARAQCYHRRGPRRGSDMVWCYWVVGGIALLAFEVATPGGLFALFFGVGALCVAPLAALGFSSTVQWFAFTVLSLVGLATLRGTLLHRLSRHPPAQAELVGEQALLLEDLPAGGEGKAELRGTPWTARAASGAPLAKGQRCLVERVEGLTLWLRAE
jgi:membrane protein implicated in regulation of membrane protease activity